MARSTRPTTPDLREQILADFAALKVPLTAETFDAALARADREGLSHLQFLHLVIAEQANLRRERSIVHRIHEARFREPKTLASFDWDFNRSIHRAQIEELAAAEFIRRHDNIVLVGQSGVGKSFLIQAIGQCACVLGLRVRYTTSADLLKDLTASLADQTLPQRVRYYARFDLVIIDEFGFDKSNVLKRRKPPACSTRSSTPAASSARRHWSPTSTSKPGANTSAIRHWRWRSWTASWTAPSS